MASSAPTDRHAPTIRTATSAVLRRAIVVNDSGRTLYHLAPENARHLLCTESCLRLWPPFTVPSRRAKLSAGPGVQGGLAILRRPDGKLQVTLRGLPLYRFSGDNASGQANGQGIHSFRGVWNVVLPRAPKLPPNPPPI